MFTAAPFRHLRCTPGGHILEKMEKMRRGGTRRLGGSGLGKTKRGKRGVEVVKGGCIFQNGWWKRAESLGGGRIGGGVFGTKTNASPLGKGKLIALTKKQKRRKRTKKLQTNLGPRNQRCKKHQTARQRKKKKKIRQEKTSRVPTHFDYIPLRSELEQKGGPGIFSHYARLGGQKDCGERDCPIEKGTTPGKK